MATPSSSPHNHEELLAALSGSIRDAVAPNTKPPLWKRAAVHALFWGRIALGLVVVGVAFWALGYILAWQNILPFVPEWWHGFAIAFAIWAFQVLMPPTITINAKLR